MTASVVTFSVQLGTDGEAIARLVASKLGYRYYDRQVITEAAAKAEVSPETVASAEHWPGFLERMLESLGRASVLSDAVPGTAVVAEPAALMLTSADYRKLIEQVVKELAGQGRCVIVGHAGQAILKDTAGVYKVLVHGSAERRAERLAAQRVVSVNDARALVDDADKQRIEFFKHVYNVEWLDSGLYDLTVNMDEVEIESGVSLAMTGIAAVH